MSRNNRCMLELLLLAITLVTCSLAQAQTIGDAIARQGADRDRHGGRNHSGLIAMPKEDNEMPTLSAMAGTGNSLTVKFSTRDGVVSVSEPNAQINAAWIFLRQDSGLSVVIQNISTKKTYRITMKIPDDLEFGQQDRDRSPNPVEMSVPPLPSAQPH